MHVLIGRKQIVLSALAVMLGLAVFINWYFSDSGTELTPEGAAPAEEQNDVGEIELVNADADDYFASVRLQRAEARDESLEQLRNVLAQEDADGEKAVQTAAMIDAIASAGKRESDIESLVSSALGAECVAVISDNSVEIVVGGDTLNEESVLRISDIVNSVCGGDYENVRIRTAAA